MLTRPLTQSLTSPLSSALGESRWLSAFNPLTLFSAGEQGALFDPSRMDSLFQDSAGTTPVTAMEQPVGRMLDLSGRGNHVTQSTAANRPTVSARVNVLLATDVLATQSVTLVAGQYTLSFTGAGSVTLSGAATGTLTGGGSLAFTATAGSVTLTVSGSVTRAQINPGAIATRYQRVTTATDYDTAGFPVYLKFDGVKTGLSSSALTLSASTAATIFVACNKASDTNAGTIFSYRSSAALENGIILNKHSAGQPSFGASSGGSAHAFGSTYPDYPAPRPGVFSVEGDIPAPLARTHINLRESITSLATQGTGVYGDNPIMIGSLASTSEFFNGQFYGGLLRFAPLDTVLRAKVWRYLVGKCGLLEAAIRFEGDSYMFGNGTGILPAFLETKSGRPVLVTARGGASMADILARMQDAANSYLLSLPTVFWDGQSNGYTTTAAYLDTLQASINLLGHSRFIVIPAAVAFGQSTTPGVDIATEMQNRWPNNFLDWRPYIPNTAGVINQDQMYDYPTDPQHLNDSALTAMAVAINTFIAAKGW